MGVSKQLLFTSDDFGMSHAINLGITQAISRGFCASTNFLAPAPWFSEAVSLAKDKKLEVGVHLDLTCDWDRLKWRPLTGNPRLMEEDGSLPAMHTGLERLGATDSDMYEELKAQVLLVKKHYGTPTHVDTHMAGGAWRGGIYDRLQKVILKLAADFGLIYTYEQNPENGKLKHFVDEFCISGESFQKIFEKLESWTEPGRYHAYGHAAVDSPELWAMCSEAHPSRVWAGEYRVKDLEFYLNRENRKRIESMGFQLIHVNALAA
jgi:predicted glycoside hydrolase/deacetylase ChbG (UPF0249 family)